MTRALDPKIAKRKVPKSLRIKLPKIHNDRGVSSLRKFICSSRLTGWLVLVSWRWVLAVGVSGWVTDVKIRFLCRRLLVLPQDKLYTQSSYLQKRVPPNTSC